MFQRLSAGCDFCIRTMHGNFRLVLLLKPSAVPRMVEIAMSYDDQL